MLPGELHGGADTALPSLCLAPVNPSSTPFCFGKEWGQEESSQSCSTAKSSSQGTWGGAGPVPLLLTRAVCPFPGHPILALPFLDGLLSQLCLRDLSALALLRESLCSLCVAWPPNKGCSLSSRSLSLGTARAPFP